MEIFDVLGVGFGPANIAVAAANEELGTNLKIRFFEKNKSSAWQAGMQFGQSDIQNHPLRDLVTPRNPRSKYSFINFLHTKGRLFEFLNLGITHALRSEYSQYIEWVAQHFADNVSYGTEVKSIDYVHITGHPLYKIITNKDDVYYGRSLIVAPGRTPYIPKPFDKISSRRVVHLNDFMPTLNKNKGKSLERVAVVGGSQSAVEILLHLSETLPDTEIFGFCRAFGYRMKDVSPFTGEVYFPKFVDTYFSSSSEQKRILDNDLRFTNYSATDADVLDALYLKMYQEKIDGKERIVIARSSKITNADIAAEGRVSLFYSSVEAPEVAQAEFDLVILATGFRNLGASEDDEKLPPILSDLAKFTDLDHHGVLKVNKDYSVPMKADVSSHAPLFLNGLCESSHGMGDAGSFSMLSLRSAVIVNAVSEKLKNEPIHARTPEVI
jgi:L-ornithine N5-oxygenase